MDIQTCFQILDLPMGASPDQVRLAYKDLVTIWHPDRFANNPRLRRRAEAKLKEINQAYETLEAFGSLGATSRTADPHHPGSGPGTGSVEVVAEMGTRLFLGFCSRLYSAVRKLTDTAIPAGPQETGDSKRRRPTNPR